MTAPAPGDAADLGREALAGALGRRPTRSYPALLSTDAEALAWARRGAAAGAVVVAAYQASPRGRAGIIWTFDPSCSLAFSMVVRPDVPAEREGWLYSVATCALADVVGADAAIRWPDEVTVAGAGRGAVGVQAELQGDRLPWAVVGLLMRDTPPPRGPLLAGLADAVDTRLAQAVDDVLADHQARCATLGRRVRARLLPLGPAAPVVEGTAAATLADGALVVRTDEGRRVAVRPQNVGFLDELE
ncbi:MAG: biotin--[acetyl-CoA-carboxylase] ligase [Acidimicrobiales bacterium]